MRLSIGGRLGSSVIIFIRVILWGLFMAKRRISPVNLEIYKRIVDALTVGSQRPDLTHAANEIRDNRELVFAAYGSRNVSGSWDRKYNELIRFAERKAHGQRKRRSWIEEHVSRKSYVSCSSF